MSGLLLGTISALTGPVGRYLALAVVLFVAVHLLRVDAARDARAECRQETQQAEMLARDERVRQAEGIAERARARATASEIAVAELERITDGILQELDGDACLISDDLRERLRSIQ